MTKYPCPPASSAAPRERREETAPDVQAILRGLPPDAYALTASMGAEDKEVLAFFIARPAGEEGLFHMADQEFGHPPVFNCRCFECYGNYWWRWQCSAVQGQIDQAMEAFDDHVAAGMMAADHLSDRRGIKARRDGDEEQKAEEVREEGRVFPPTDDSTAPAVFVEREGLGGGVGLFKRI